jgi:mono/diheme cytochrome c family protein
MNARHDLRACVAGAVLTLVLAACGGGEPAQVSEGQALYDVNCADCHGDQLLGDGPMAANLPIEPPSLLEHLGHHPMDQLVQLIRSGVPPAMPPAPLTDDQVRLVIDYAWTLVPDSMVVGLREMQRQAEMGMPMDMPMGGMEMEGDSADAMSGMDHSEHMMAPDTAGR